MDNLHKESSMRSQADDNMPVDNQEEQQVTSRRSFLLSLGQWSVAAISIAAGGAVTGGLSGCWVNRDGGGTSWSNRDDNRDDRWNNWGHRHPRWHDSGGRPPPWANRGESWGNRGSGWGNRGGEGWGNHRP